MHEKTNRIGNGIGAKGHERKFHLQSLAFSWIQRKRAVFVVAVEQQELSIYPMWY